VRPDPTGPHNATARGRRVSPHSNISLSVLITGRAMIFSPAFSIDTSCRPGSDDPAG
jgi:hypothetical protein